MFQIKSFSVLNIHIGHFAVFNTNVLSDIIDYQLKVLHFQFNVALKEFLITRAELFNLGKIYSPICGQALGIHSTLCSIKNDIIL